MLSIVLLALAAALVAGALAPIMSRIGFAVGAIDRPDHRKIHESAVSRLGGVAVWGAVVYVVALSASMGFLDGAAFVRVRVVWPCLALGAALLALVGIVDDVRGLRPGLKLLAQGVAALCVVAGGCVIREATNPFTGASVALGMLAVPVTVLWVIGVTNALNLIDGLDGLAAGVGLIVSGTLCLISASVGRADVALVTGVLAGALAGFLYFNFNPATIFLGDSGSSSSARARRPALVGARGATACWPRSWRSACRSWTRSSRLRRSSCRRRSWRRTATTSTTA
jgi:UDP-GlcNAc:undecaprenyl-phosphate GlcNAc-1-phosphate transferase